MFEEKSVFAFIALTIKFEAIKANEKKSHIILESYGAIISTHAKS